MQEPSCSVTVLSEFTRVPSPVLENLILSTSLAIKQRPPVYPMLPPDSPALHRRAYRQRCFVCLLHSDSSDTIFPWPSDSGFPASGCVLRQQMFEGSLMT